MYVRYIIVASRNIGPRAMLAISMLIGDALIASLYSSGQLAVNITNPSIPN